MITLALTSSTSLVGLAIGDAAAGPDTPQGRLLAERTLLTERRHAEEITPMLAAVLAEAAVDLAEIERIVVDVGPGRYTGMRVGIATAKTLAFAIGVPVVAVSSLELIGLGAGRSEGSADDGVAPEAMFAVVDARRDQVFAQQIHHGGPVDPPMVLSPAELIAMLPSGSLLVGDGADRYADDFTAVARVQAGIGPSVAAAALLDPARSGGAGQLVAPLYLREPDAAINIKTRHSVPPQKTRPK